MRLADEHRGRRIFTYGPLIHNPQTVQMLAEKGIMVFGDGDFEPQAGDIVVIRSHGVAPAVIEELRRKNFEIFDATCPKVAYVHRIARDFSRRGYAVIIVGDANHAEVVGIKGEVQGDVAVVNDPAQVSQLPDWDRVVVVAQTTMDVDTFDAVVEAVRRKFREVVVKNTLCSETSYRQREIRELARDNQAFVVIGGRNSANTKRLYQLATRTGLPTFWVETADELNPADFEGIERVAVVAGASTPHWIIDQVVERLETMHSKFLPPWKWRWLKAAAYFVLRSNLWSSVAAGFLAFAIGRDIFAGDILLRAASVMLTLFAALNLYEYREWQGLALMDPSKVQFVRQHRRFLLAASIVSLAGALAASFVLGGEYPIIEALLAAAVAGYLIFPVFERVLPASVKDGGMLALWVLLVWGVGTGWDWRYLVPVAMFGAIRGLVMGLKELETDRILQRKSITAALGEKPAVWLGILPAVVGVVWIHFVGGWTRCGGFVAGMILMWFLAALVGFRILRKGSYIEVLSDIVVVITGLLCL